MLKKSLTRIVAGLGGMVAFAATALAQDGRLGMAREKQIDFQPPATDLMERLIGLHTEVLYIITGITILVLGLLLFIMLRFNKRVNPKPSRTSHNTLLEIVWTVIPIIILVFMAVPSIKLLYYQDETPEGELLIKVTGHQWYWTYEYPEHGLVFDSIMLPDEYYSPDISENDRQQRDQILADMQQVLGLDEPPEIHRLLDTDTRVVVPVNTTVKVLVTADDVIHSWTIPAFGFKIDAVPGRVNETWFNVDEVGTYYGQCSELCGLRHAFMPIVVEVVSQEDFEAWLTRAKFFYADAGPETGNRLATAETQE